MKKMFLFFALMATGLVYKAEAQIRLNVNVNLQPDWGPTGYDHADYYYFPDNDIYYDISGKRFVYQNRGRWVFTSTLPKKYQGTDLYHSYKVVLNERKPYMHNDQNRVKYASFRGRKDQPVRRDNHDNRNNRNDRKDDGKGNKGHH